MNRIHRSAIIGDGVELGEDVVVGPYAVLVGQCTVGDGVWVGPHATVGTPAEFRTGEHPPWDAPGRGSVVIGKRCVVRENVTINAGHVGATVLGDECYIMATAHVGHDSIVEDEVTLATGVTLAGHVRVGAWANVGLAAVVHQRMRVGPGAMVGMAAVVHRDVEPFTIAVGAPARMVRRNQKGMAALGWDSGQDPPPRVSAVLQRWVRMNAPTAS